MFPSLFHYWSGHTMTLEDHKQSKLKWCALDFAPAGLSSVSEVHCYSFGMIVTPSAAQKAAADGPKSYVSEPACPSLLFLSVWVLTFCVVKSHSVYPDTTPSSNNRKTLGHTENVSVGPKDISRSQDHAFCGPRLHSLVKHHQYQYLMVFSKLRQWRK